MMGLSLYEHIHTYLLRDVYPFHMPGHKRNAAFLPPDLLRLDMTEFPGMDNLHAPESIIQTAQDYAAALYGADESFFLVNGASSGVVAAVCASCFDGDTIAVARNAHVSAYHGMVFSGASPVFFLPECTEDGLVGGVTPARVMASIDRCSLTSGAVKAVFLTSPTYEGFTSDIAAIAAAVHRKNAILIVDEAHGAHFPFHGLFPKPAITQGADIVINSLHKTLPALSPCALLHIRGHRVDRTRLRYFLKAAQTTSPSYMMMAAADYMLRMLSEQSGHFDAYAARLTHIRHTLPGYGGDTTDYLPLRLIGTERIGTAGIHDFDRGKIVFSVNAVITGMQIAEIAASTYGVQLEMATARHLLAMTSVADTEEGFERLLNTVDSLNRHVSSCSVARKEQLQKELPLPLPLPEPVITPRAAVNLPVRTVPWTQATGEISGMFITPYPPGIPLLAPGERITQAIAEAIAVWGGAGDSVKILSRR